MTWDKRLDDLMWACGWTIEATAEKFGVSIPTIASMLKGKRPKVQFIVRLKQLEAAYAGEIEALHQGLIIKSGNKRHNCRDDFRRPEDRAPLVANDAMGENIRFGDGERPPVPSRVVYLSPQGRRRVEAYKKSIARRSATIGGRSGDAA